MLTILEQILLKKNYINPTSGKVYASQWDDPEYYKVPPPFDDPATKSRLGSAFRNNYFAQFGLLTTIGALCMGLYYLGTSGSAIQNNYMMRLRVLAQGFTILSIVGFTAFETWTNKDTPPEPEYHNYPPTELTSQITSWQKASTNPFYNPEVKMKMELATKKKLEEEQEKEALKQAQKQARRQAAEEKKK